VLLQKLEKKYTERKSEKKSGQVWKQILEATTTLYLPSSNNIEIMRGAFRSSLPTLVYVSEINVRDTQNWAVYSTRDFVQTTTKASDHIIVKHRTTRDSV